MKAVLFTLIALVSLSSLHATAQGYVTLPDGTTRYVPSTHELVVVRKGTGGLVRVTGADAYPVEELPTRPVSEKPVECTPEGELTLGAPPCED